MTVHEVWLTALNNHKATDVEFEVVDQAWGLEVLLSNDVSELLDKIDKICLLLRNWGFSTIFITTLLFRSCLITALNIYYQVWL